MEMHYVAVFEEGETKPCGALPLDLAIGLLPVLKSTGRDYYFQQITQEDVARIRRNITELSETVE